MPSFAKILILFGAMLVLLGLIIWLAGHRLNWFGHLPGDIRLERGNIRFYAPIASMFLLSIIVSLLWWVIRRLF
jgi:hypothetical protein